MKNGEVWYDEMTQGEEGVGRGKKADSRGRNSRIAWEGVKNVVDIKELESVLAVYRNKSFSEAAYQMNFSLSAISKQVARVEKELDVKLFERKTKASKMTLTTEGESVLPAIERVVVEYENLQWQVENCKNRTNNSLSIGFVPLVGTVGETRIISDYMAKYPGVEVVQVLLFQKELVRLLLSGMLDGVFIFMLGDYEGNREIWETLTNDELRMITTMKSEKLWLGVSDKHPLAQGEEADLREFKNERFIFSSAQNPNRCPTQIRKITGLAGMKEEKLKTRFLDFIQRDIVLDQVARGAGVLPLACCPPEKHEGIRFLPVKDWDVTTTGVFLCRKSNKNRVLRDFCACVDNYCKNER